MAVKNAMTDDFLHSAYGGESLAHMRYLTWGDMAKKDGYPKIAQLFEGIAHAERVHAENHFKVIDGPTTSYTVTAGGEFGTGNIVDNLQGAIDGERHEVEQMYPVYLNAAEFQGEKDARRSFHYAVEAEKDHIALFTQAQDLARQGKDMDFTFVYVCPVCGHTVLNEAPERCPVCSVKKDLFVKF